MMNRVFLIGRLCKEVDFKILATTNGDLPVSRYTLAVDRKGKKDDTDFISCVCFGKTAEFAHEHLYKGIKIAVEGRIQTGSYEKDGRKIYTTDVLIDNHEFCEKKEPKSEPAADDFMNVSDDIAEEMPFKR